VTLFDAAEYHPPSRTRRYIFTAVGVIVTLAAFVLVFPDYLWYPFVYYREVNTIRHFIIDVTRGDMQPAYEVWKPSPSYSFKDFMDDWGPEGYYGPVKSYRLGRPEHIKNGSAAEIVLDVSPSQPFPDKTDALKLNKTKEVRLWVEFRDQSISFPPE
jgi:hypothetical protein